MQCLEPTQPVGDVTAMPFEGVRCELAVLRPSRQQWFGPALAWILDLLLRKKAGYQQLPGHCLQLATCRSRAIPQCRVPSDLGRNCCLDGNDMRESIPLPAGFICAELLCVPSGFCCPLWSSLGKNSELEVDKGSYKLIGRVCGLGF